MSRRRAGAGARAVGLLAAGAGALVAALGFGTPALGVLGAGLLALPVLAALAVAAAAAGLRPERTVAPARLVAGEVCTARVRADGWPARLGLTALLDWTVDPGLDALGPVVVRRRGRRAPALEAEAGPAVRGLHRLAPAEVVLGDPFGLVRLARAADAGREVVVAAWAPELARPFWAGGDARADGSGIVGRGRGTGDLEGVRDHRPGDPLSRIHWPQTAKRGRLQAKELRGSQAGEGATVVVLDDRADPAVAGKPDGAFEVAVAAAAALVRHLAERGSGVRLVIPGAGVGVGPSPDVWPAAEDALARVEAAGRMPVSLGLRAACGPESPARRVVVVTAAPDPGLADAVRSARTPGRAVSCVLCGAAGAAAGDLARAGAGVAWAAGMEDLAAALGAEGRRAAV